MHAPGHLTPAQVESYALGRIIEGDELARVEEHLLLCAQCQQAVRDEDAIRAALRKSFRQGIS